MTYVTLHASWMILAVAVYGLVPAVRRYITTAESGLKAGSAGESSLK